MAKASKLSGTEINFIDRILRSMFGNEIPLYQIENARQNYLSIRDAANNLNQYSDPPEKLKIILNLIALAYHDRQRVHVLGNVEIVELVDLLQLDVNLLGQIFDLFEGVNSSLDLLGMDFSPSESSVLSNSMVWAAENGDYKFMGKHSDARLSFIMIEDLVMVCAKSCSETNCPYSIIEPKTGVTKYLKPGIFELLHPDSILVLDGKNGEIIIHHDILWTFYNLMFNPDDHSVKLPNGEHLSFAYKNRKLVKVGNERSSVFGAKVNELVLDESPDHRYPELSVLSLIAVKTDRHANLHEQSEHFLEQKNKRFFISNIQNSNSLLHFHFTGEQLLAERLGEADIFINRKHLQQSSPFNFNQDILNLGSNNYIINRNWELIEIPIEIEELNVEEIHHTFSSGGNIALDGISFQITRGKMMAIMGPSGSGKTTLLKILLGEMSAERSKILIDGMDFVANYTFFQKYIGYVPQDDLLFSQSYCL